MRASLLAGLLAVATAVLLGGVPALAPVAVAEAAACPTITAAISKGNGPHQFAVTVREPGGYGNGAGGWFVQLTETYNSRLLARDDTGGQKVRDANFWGNWNTYDLIDRTSLTFQKDRNNERSYVALNVYGYGTCRTAYPFGFWDK